MRIKRLSGLVGKARLRSNQMRQYFNAIVIDRAAGTECIEIGKLPPTRDARAALGYQTQCVPL